MLSSVIAIWIFPKLPADATRVELELTTRFPVTVRSPPTFRFFSIPTPPSMTTAPVSLLVDSVVL